MATGEAPAHLRTRAEQHAAGKRLRETCPRDLHANWKALKDRRGAVDTVLAAEKGRLPDLMPLRHGRMARSPFTFYRGSALAMAGDLAPTPSTGLRVQCCGDAHLSNFGGFATPERRILFSINDLDETLPAPWEWDLKRLAASFVVACRDNGLKDSFARAVAETCVRTYRESMFEFSQLKTLELWYQGMWADDLMASTPACVRLEDRRARLLDLQEQRIALAGHEEQDPAGGPDAANTDGLQGRIRQLVPLQQGLIRARQS